MSANTAAPRYQLIELDRPAATFVDDVLRGLTATPKWLPPKWFYDGVGSSLFDAICHLPEYYVTRAETEILTTHAREIAHSFGAPARVVELGSGTARKTRFLLDELREIEYVPVDVDAEMLAQTGRDLVATYASLTVTAIASDFSQPSAALRALPRANGPTVVLFLGSTIGNLDAEESRAMLRDLRAALREGDFLFLGADLVKPKSILEPAYDDPLGVTAAFNKNVLQRINQELGGTFDLAAFAHRAFFDERHSRMEMHLVSTRSQRVFIAALGREIAFGEGETIHTESSHKYDLDALQQLARDCGYDIERIWNDSRSFFADLLWRVHAL